MQTFQDLILALQNVRTPREYSGWGIRGGRVPGELNIPHEQNWVTGNDVAAASRHSANVAETAAVD